MVHGEAPREPSVCRRRRSIEYSVETFAVTLTTVGGLAKTCARNGDPPSVAAGSEET